MVPPGGRTPGEWCTLVPGGVFAPRESDTDPLLLQNKPAWLLGSQAWPGAMVEEFYYGAVWCECSAVNTLSPRLFDRRHAVWSPLDHLLIDFIEANSLAVALWCYYKPVSMMVRKCQ